VGSKRRSNTFTRFLEDIVDDTKDFVDDLIDRSKDVETDTRDAITDAVDDESSDDDRREMEALRATLMDLKNKVDELSSQKSGSKSPGS
jgi:polyhydroxyalkanoate synthesis regulator phasin